jgi:cyclophilin family peptidyl-prolyl cis-trans isomerase
MICKDIIRIAKMKLKSRIKMTSRTRATKSNRHHQTKDHKKLFRILSIAAIVVVVAVIIGLIVSSQAANKPEAAVQTAVPIATNIPAATEAPAATGAPAAAETPVKEAKQYSKAPDMQIDSTKTYLATFKMAKGGEFVIQLYADKAPITVNSFVFLAKEGFFDGLTFHRVVEGFMAQGGDPTGTGMGGPGYEFVNEDSDLTFDKAGVVAMANAGRDTNGSQFFITFAPADFLNGDYTIFGQVTEGMDVVNEITRRDPQKNPDFTGDVIESVVITEK